MNKNIKVFLEYLEGVRNVSSHTLRNYHLDLEAFFSYLGEDVELPKISKHEVRRYLAHLNHSGFARRTVLRRLSALRSFFRYLKKGKVIAHNPMDEVESPKGEKLIPSALSYEQVERLFAQPDTSTLLGFRDRCMMELLYSSALRVSELVALSRRDFDAKGRVLRVLGKGRKERHVPITKSAASYVERYLNHPKRHEEGKPWQQKDAEAVFLNKWGRRLTTRSVDRKFRLYLLQSGMSGHITPHTIRHTIATHWLEKGMDLKMIQMLLGHSSPAATTIYTKVSTRLKREVYEKAHPRAGRGN